MIKWRVYIGLLLVTATIASVSCEKDIAANNSLIDNRDNPRPYHLKVPPGFPDYFLEDENSLTYEGVALGRKLFFDPRLSRNGNVSCASCHLVEDAFSDPRAKSIGTNNTPTGFHSMPIFNIAWMNEFFWDGRAKSREEQALLPVTNPLEMDLTWPEAVDRISADEDYLEMFEKAFGTQKIDSMLVVKAMVQYEMTLVSSKSRFDREWRNEIGFTDKEAAGKVIFESEAGDCWHCHGTILATDNDFHNNGLDAQADLEPGLFGSTQNQEDFGKFKTPSLRNLAFTAPYMHDGRFQTLEEVIEFYSTGVNHYDGVDALMKKSEQGGLQLTAEQKDQLIAYLMTMTDSSFVTETEDQSKLLRP